MFTVEIIYATLKHQNLITIQCHDGDTINDVVLASGLLDKYPDIDLAINKVGIFNQVKKLDEPVKHQDRVEIYRALIADPKEARRKRAIKQKQQGVLGS